MIIRNETSSDIETVQALTEAAFAPMAFSDGTEAAALAGLRDAGDLRLSLVAEVDGRVMGHVAFSDVLINDAPSDWVGLGPIAVMQERQRQGIGTALVKAGAERLLAEGAAGIVLIGNPAVYAKMGFVSDGGLSYRALPAPIVQFLPFGTARPVGRLTFSPALENA